MGFRNRAEAPAYTDQVATVTHPGTPAPVEALAETYDSVRGFKNLPPKDQILAASIYAGFRQALREEREDAEQDRLRRKLAGLTSADL